MRIACVPTWEFADAVVSNRVWGSNRSRFGKWAPGETLVILVGREGVVVATTTGKPFTSNQVIWEDDLYEYRILVGIERVLRGAAGLAANQAVHKALAAGVGDFYGVYIMSQTRLPETGEELVRTALERAAAGTTPVYAVGLPSRAEGIAHQTCRPVLSSDSGGVYYAGPCVHGHHRRQPGAAMSTMQKRNDIFLGDNLDVLKSNVETGSIDLIYIDPPFNTGHDQSRTQIRASMDESGTRVGFQGKRYSSIRVGTLSFSDMFDDYLGFLAPRLEEAHRVLAPNGSLYFHIDYREVHYCKLLLDSIFGRESFLNEVIWAYDYGGRPKNRWPPKHDNILVYVKNPNDYVFNYEAIDRIPYMAPGLVGPEKAARGKMPTDTWWHTIVATNGREKTGYPTQKPLDILRRIVTASSPKGGRVLDFFAGSGTTGAACLELGRSFCLVDNNPKALQVMAKRFQNETNIEWHGFDPACFWEKTRSPDLFTLGTRDP